MCVCVCAVRSKNEEVRNIHQSLGPTAPFQRTERDAIEKQWILSRCWFPTERVTFSQLDGGCGSNIGFRNSCMCFLEGQSVHQMARSAYQIGTYHQIFEVNKRHEVTSDDVTSLEHQTRSFSFQRRDLFISWLIFVPHGPAMTAALTRGEDEAAIAELLLHHV